MRCHQLAVVLFSVITVLVAASACTSTASSSPTDQLSATAASPHATGASPRVGLTQLRCADAIGADAPEQQSSVVLGVVGLPTSPRYWALQAYDSGSADPNAKLFAKTGLTVKVGASFTITIPPDYADRARIGWGNPAEPTTSLSVNACADTYRPGATWLDYAGGYYVKSPMCLPVLVEGGGRKQRVTVGVGTPCPGQKPVPTS